MSLFGQRYQMLFLGDTKSRLPSWKQLQLAHNITLCSLVAGGESGMSVEITLSAHIPFVFFTGSH